MRPEMSVMRNAGLAPRIDAFLVGSECTGRDSWCGGERTSLLNSAARATNIYLSNENEIMAPTVDRSPWRHARLICTFNVSSVSF
jgi:hypothetical protein